MRDSFDLTRFLADWGLTPVEALFFLATAILVLAFVGLILGGRRARAAAAPLSADLVQLADTVDKLSQMQSGMQGSLQQLSDAQISGQTHIMRAVDERLEAVSHRMGDSLSTSATRTAASLAELQTRLQTIDAAQQKIEKLSSEVVSLQDILANKQARGAFGEIQLNDIVVTALPPSAYSFQTTLSNGKRADCVLTLPNPPGSIAVDAKFPLESYAALRAAGNEAERTAAMRSFKVDLLKHVSAIAERYIIPGETADSALLFLPSEAVYAELHANFPDVVKQSYQARVWIVSPTTMMATLNTVRAILKDVNMREQAGAIRRQMSLLFEDVDRLSKRVGNLQRHFSRSEQDIREIVTSAGKIGRRAARIEEVQFGNEDETLPEPASQSHLHLTRT